MIFAAGLGSRLKPWTDHHPKALAMVNGKPLLQRNIEYLQQYGIREVMVNVHHFAAQINNAIQSSNGWGSNITVSDETDAVLETGGGLKKAGWYFTKGNFVVINVDVLTDCDLGNMMDQHYRYAPLATVAVRNRNTSRYFLFDDQHNLCGWRNITSGEEIITRPVQKPVQQAFSGIHIIGASIFPLISRQGKFSMVDLYLDLAATNKIRAYDHSDSAFIDVGRPESVTEAEKIFK